MVGSQTLQELLRNPAVNEIISVTRKSNGIKHEKIKEIIHADFLDFTNILKDLTEIDTCFYCLGVYQNTVDRKRYEEITCMYQKALTDVLENISPDLTFVLFGAAGADSSEKSKILFAKVKGKAENLLKATLFPKKYIFRPSFIKPTGTRKPRGLTYKITLPVISVLFKLFPKIGLTDKELARVMVKTGIESELSSQTFENSHIRKML